MPVRSVRSVPRLPCRVTLLERRPLLQTGETSSILVRGTNYPRQRIWLARYERAMRSSTLRGGATCSARWAGPGLLSQGSEVQFLGRAPCPRRWTRARGSEPCELQFDSARGRQLRAATQTGKAACLKSRCLSVRVRGRAPWTGSVKQARCCSGPLNRPQRVRLPTGPPPPL